MSGCSSIAVCVAVNRVVSVRIDFSRNSLPDSLMKSRRIGYREVDDPIRLKMLISIQQSMRPDILVPVHASNHKHSFPLRFILERLILVLIVKVLASLAIAELIIIGEVRDIVDVPLRDGFFPLLEVLVVVSYASVRPIDR